MLCNVLFPVIFLSMPLNGADLSPFKWLLAQATYGNPLHLLTGHVPKKLDDVCERSVDCVELANSLCINGRCQCQKGYFPSLEDTSKKNPQRICKIALDFHQKCQNSTTGPKECREPFICNSKNLCDCPEGFLPTNGTAKCIRDCKANHILVKSKNEEQTEICVPLLELGEECGFNEQCSTRYAQCLGGRCQCISGTLRRQSQCVTVKQCPLGEAPLENGYPLICDRKTLKCPDGNYCLFAQFTDTRGFCCPTMKVNCPVGTPLSYGCANCPWETHHCFTYSIGTHQQSMCCPNDCPRNLPIRHGDKCYAIVGHGSHCSVDEQCLSILNSVCLGSSNETRSCQCPSGHILIDGICQKVSKLGGECEVDSDCFTGSNTVCKQGYCKCGDGFIPEPAPTNWNEGTSFAVEHCIAEPSCPTVNGLVPIEQYEDCSGKTGCSDGKYCRQWFHDPLKDRTFSICCPIPTVRDFEEICSKFGMKMLLANGLESAQLARPFRCGLSNAGDSRASATPAESCPVDSACIFNPFAVNKGICCRYEKRSPRRNEKLDRKSGATTHFQAAAEGTIFRFPFSA